MDVIMYHAGIKVMLEDTVHTKDYAHSLHSIVFCCGEISTSFTHIVSR